MGVAHLSTTPLFPVSTLEELAEAFEKSRPKEPAEVLAMVVHALFSVFLCLSWATSLVQIGRYFPSSKQEGTTDDEVNGFLGEMEALYTFAKQLFEFLATSTDAQVVEQQQVLSVCRQGVSF